MYLDHLNGDSIVKNAAIVANEITHLHRFGSKERPLEIYLLANSDGELWFMLGDPTSIDTAAASSHVTLTHESNHVEIFSLALHLVSSVAHQLDALTYHPATPWRTTVTERFCP